VLGLIQGESPALYEEVLSRLPAEQRAERQRIDAVRRASPVLTPTLPPPPPIPEQPDSIPRSQ
jgi:hypothetical protein